MGLNPWTPLVSSCPTLNLATYMISAATLQYPAFSLRQCNILAKAFRQAVNFYPIVYTLNGFEPPNFHLMLLKFPPQYLGITLRRPQGPIHDNGNLYLIFPSYDTVPYILSTQNIDTFLQYHRDLGHTCSKNLHEYLKTCYWWPKMLDNIKKVLVQYEVCEKYARSKAP
ncbi:hypothetical protein DSO57_1002802 [Entomophthora muscae]|uniref:Uncharacterized protein n=1 Tax=Entomophthora muscae TaxID=34485 RepID=A0ACC2SAU4_9FUNG|nr:hypothetical protein DSO57_1002802 [Entomophthora muscae]